MNIKKINNKLSQIRENSIDSDYISEEDRMDLLTLVHETIMEAQASKQATPKDISLYLPIADNDNKPLTTEQKFRLRLMEKTDSGSASIH